ncbi:MAG: WYL domain-containing protein [Acidimicrobiia bacterium]|jgi:proteasome accessory factor B|nr:WYL domain-containing protein [Acidimicrobiia bacterium]
MASSTVKLHRLLNLLAALSETRVPLSADDLRTKLGTDPAMTSEAFRRSFERDKAELRDMGIDVVVDEVPGSDPPEPGYRVPRDQYAVRNPDLDADEAAALQLAVSLVRLEGLDGGAGLWKVAGPGSPAATTPSVTAALPRHDQLGALFAAATERRAATFTYRGERRTIDPYRLDFTNGHWYLHGYDHERQEERNFRVDRIDGQPRTGPPGSFTRPATAVAGSRLDPWAIGAGEAVTARLRVDAAQAPVAVTTLGAGAVEAEGPDGSIVVELAVSHRDGFRSFVLGFLEHAEVLSPPELRADVVAWLQGVTGDAG